MSCTEKANRVVVVGEGSGFVTFRVAVAPNRCIVLRRTSNDSALLGDTLRKRSNSFGKSCSDIVRVMKYYFVAIDCERSNVRARCPKIYTTPIYPIRDNIRLFNGHTRCSKMSSCLSLGTTASSSFIRPMSCTNFLALQGPGAMGMEGRC